MANLKFPRPTVKAGNCVAAVRASAGYFGISGTPILRGRPFVRDEEGRWWKGARLSYHLNVSKIPRVPRSRKKGFVLHTCDNKWCINPRHLYVGTAQQNIIDLYARHPTIHKQRRMETKGIKKTKKHRKALSRFWLGRPKPWLRGKSLSPEHRRKLSKIKSNFWKKVKATGHIGRLDGFRL